MTEQPGLKAGKAFNTISITATAMVSLLQPCFFFNNSAMPVGVIEMVDCRAQCKIGKGKNIYDKVKQSHRLHTLSQEIFDNQPHGFRFKAYALFENTCQEKMTRFGRPASFIMHHAPHRQVLKKQFSQSCKG